ncbi:MAG: prepilin-type N-terminal cleavage/methylation domain-containing protein [Bdellovibrionaceae bacterium]|jgi:prepilin-type N-terminal cleavage/methylation domain-containing protein|nr:prepilin-type N-terminal cleavage/methylation domain-containing protein [Pseudobdellovibrionaceae bacterium]
MTKLINKNSGFTLIEVIMAILLIAVLTSVAVVEIGDSFSENSFESTRNEMLEIRNALVGDPNLKQGGSRISFGYLGDVGGIPSAVQGLAALTVNPGVPVTGWAVDATERIGVGWNGPYLSSGSLAQDWTTDAWGNAYVYAPTATPPTLTSRGADGVAGGTALNQDIVIQLPDNTYKANVYGVILDNGSVFSGDAEVVFNYPNGSGVLTTSTDTVVAGDNGSFSFTNIPMGVRSFTVYFPSQALPTTTYGPVVFSVGSSEYLIPANRTNLLPSNWGCSGLTIGFQSSTSNDAENVSPANLIVEASGYCGSDMTVDYALADGSATGGADYTSTTGTVTILSGNTSANLPIVILDDGATETDETLTATISNPHPVGTILGTSVLTYTINDDENPAVPIAKDLIITGIATTEIDIGWSTDPVIPVITDYQVEYKESASGIWLTFVDGVSADTTSTISGLTAETEYNFRVKAFNGSWGAFSNIVTGDTAPNDPFFDPTVHSAFNLGGAIDSAIVAIEAGAVITLTNATYPSGTTLTTLVNAGDTYRFTSVLNDHLSSDKEFFVAGRLGSGNDNKKGNMVWSTSSWAGKDFIFNGNRNPPHKVNVHAFEATDVEVFKAGVSQSSVTLAAGDNHTFSLGSNGGYELTSTGLIIGFIYSTQSSRVVDPHPLMPSSTSLLGIPSRDAKVSTTITSNPYSGVHSNSSTNTGTMTLGSVLNINQTGTSGLYRDNSFRITADYPIIGNSYADADGSCAAPLVPTGFLKYRFAINVNSDWVAMASIAPGTIDMIAPGGGTTELTLARSGADPNAPYKVRVGSTNAGHRFISTNVRFQAWYQPKTDTGAGDRDETVMFGYD